MGYTCEPPEKVDAWVNDQKYHNFRSMDYDPVNRNCNHFSNHMSICLTGNSIPEEFTTMGEQVLVRTLGLAAGSLTTLAAFGSAPLSFMTFFTPYVWGEWILPSWRWFKSWFSSPEENLPQITWQESELQE